MVGTISAGFSRGCARCASVPAVSDASEQAPVEGGSANPAEEASTPAPEAEAKPRRRRRMLGSAMPMDPWLFFAAVALSCMGLVMVYSSSAWLASQSASSWEYYLYRQAAFFFVGLGVMYGVSRIDYRVLRRFAPQLMIVALVMLVAVLIFGREVNGARRWISLGPVNLQPSELAKAALAIFLAATLARQGQRVRQFKRGFLPVMAAACLTMLLVQQEKDLGTTILLGALTLTMLYVAGTRATYVMAAVMIGLPIVWTRIIGVAFRSQRLEEWQSGGGYQVKQGLIAIGSGGLWGTGLGEGRQKLGHLPENHTDFIMAAIGEELGLVGVVVMVGLFGLLVWRGLAVACNAQCRFGTYLAVGLSTLFGLQAMMNMAVVLNVIPAKGITMPFVSYGGSSLLISMASVGLLLSVSRSPEPWAISDQRGRDRAKGHAGMRKSKGSKKSRDDGPRKNKRRAPMGAPLPA